MAIDPATLLTSDEKQEILLGRIKHWSTELYVQEINLDALKKADPFADTSDIEHSVKVLTAAIETCVEKINELNPDNVVEIRP